MWPPRRQAAVRRSVLPQDGVSPTAAGTLRCTLGVASAPEDCHDEGSVVGDGNRNRDEPLPGRVPVLLATRHGPARLRPETG